ncbi:MAG: hypothetical protein R2722_01980 [Tessaracoccus sp.]
MLILSAFLIASGAMVMERLSGSVGRLPGHRQAAALPTDAQGRMTAALVGFAAGHPGDRLLADRGDGRIRRSGDLLQGPGTGERHDLAESMIDNLFVAQNADFDFLLDQNDDIPRPDGGEIYVPVASGQQFGIEGGRRPTLRQHPERVSRPSGEGLRAGRADGLVDVLGNPIPDL